MSSVMEFPKNCYDCPFIRASVAGDYYCIAGDGIEEDLKKLYERRMSNCPLVEVKEPHGRLIDKDKLRHELFVNFNGERIPFYDCDNFPTKIAYRDLHSILAEQKTVIEAEGREE